jgi:hypothetical protein
LAPDKRWSSAIEPVHRRRLDGSSGLDVDDKGPATGRFEIHPGLPL